MRDADIVAELQEEASECVSAEQELVIADSDDAVDRAARKVKLACYDWPFHILAGERLDAFCPPPRVSWRTVDKMDRADAVN
jgi:hypothetical protein